MDGAQNFFILRRPQILRFGALVIFHFHKNTNRKPRGVFLRSGRDSKINY